MRIENGLKVFENEQFGKVRTINENGTVLFCGADVASALGYANPRKALDDHCPHVTKRSVGVQTGVKADGTAALQEVSVSFIPEGDVYRLIVRSKLPTAEKFERWVFDEVLPSIRKNGGYISNQENLTPELIVANALVVANNIIENQKLALEQKEKLIEEQRPHVAFSETVQKSNDNILIRDLAKLMCNDGVYIGEKRLFSLLRSFGVLMRDNSPYQTYIDRGYFKVKECTYNTPDGSVKLSNTTLVTPKGQVWLVDKTKQLIGQERITE